MAVEMEIANAEPTWENLALVPIANEDQATLVSEHLNAVKEYEKKVTLYFRGTDEKPAALVLAYRAYQDQLDKEKKALEPAKADRETCKKLLLDWDDVLADRAAEVQRIADEKARVAAETRQIEEAADVEKLAMTAPPEEAVALREEAQTILETPVHVTASQVVKAKTQGVSVSGRWKCRRDKVNVKALAKAVGDGRVDVTLVEANYTALDQRAVSSKGTAKIPGVEFYLDRNVSARGK